MYIYIYIYIHIYGIRIGFCSDIQVSLPLMIAGSPFTNSLMTKWSMSGVMLH